MMLPRVRRLVLSQRNKRPLRHHQFITDVSLLIVGYLVGYFLVQIFLNSPEYIEFLKRKCTQKSVLPELKTIRAIRSKFQSHENFEHKYDLEKELMIGVMTTMAYLATRATAINRTWGQNVPGTIVFYIGGSTEKSSSR